MGWPKGILEIIRRYYSMQVDQRNKLTEIQKNELVKELVKVYNALLPKEKTDVLIPARGEFLQDEAILYEAEMSDGTEKYAFQYEWPKEVLANNGFDGETILTELLPGEEYDRLGEEWGRYISPVIEGKPQSYLSRAIPYYIPEEDISQNPAYHRYKIGARYTNSECRKGKVAQAFRKNPPDGGGTQVYLGKTIRRIKMESRGVFDG